jgi:hypothetical protein
LDSKSAADVAASLADALEGFTGSRGALITVFDAIRDEGKGLATKARNNAAT